MVYHRGTPILPKPFPVTVDPADVPTVIVGGDHALVLGGIMDTHGKPLSSYALEDIATIFVGPDPENLSTPGKILFLREGDPASLAATWLPSRPGLYHAYVYHVPTQTTLLPRPIEVVVEIGEIQKQTVGTDVIPIGIAGITLKLDPITNTKGVRLPATPDDVLVEMTGPVVARGVAETVLPDFRLDIILCPVVPGRYQVQVYYRGDRAMPVLAESPTLVLTEAEVLKSRAEEDRTRWVQELSLLGQRLNNQIEALARLDITAYLTSLDEFRSDFAKFARTVLALQSTNWSATLQLPDDQFFRFLVESIGDLTTLYSFLQGNLILVADPKFRDHLVQNFLRGNRVATAFLQVATAAVQAPAAQRLTLTDSFVNVATAWGTIIRDAVTGLKAYQQVTAPMPSELASIDPRAGAAVVHNQLVDFLNSSKSHSTSRETICGEIPVPRNLPEATRALPSFIKTLLSHLDADEIDPKAAVFQVARSVMFLRDIFLEMIQEPEVFNKMVPLVDVFTQEALALLSGRMLKRPVDEQRAKLVAVLGEIKLVLQSH